ncbi:MAG: aldo/keto reductase [Deltaproteobacteria bacterium]|nr:MAG: aldo/keto reductase [Deltaproteobacteria bacterium]
MGTDYLDIYFCHRHDPETALEETVRAMDDLVHSGKILYWGTSEWPLGKIEEAVGLAEKYNLYKPLVEQSQYSLLCRQRLEKEILPNLARSGMGLIVFSPLASGLLTGKYDDGIPRKSRLERLGFVKETWYREEHISCVRKLKPLAEELGVQRNELALAWVLHQEGISSVITGATQRGQLESNLKALDVVLFRETLEKINKIFSENKE